MASSTTSHQAQSAAQDVLHESRVTPVQGLILLLTMVASMIEGFDIVVIAYAAPAISDDWASHRSSSVLCSAPVCSA